MFVGVVTALLATSCGGDPTIGVPTAATPSAPVASASNSGGPPVRTAHVAPPFGRRCTPGRGCGASWPWRRAPGRAGPARPDLRPGPYVAAKAWTCSRGHPGSRASPADGSNAPASAPSSRQRLSARAQPRTSRRRTWMSWVQHRNHREGQQTGECDLHGPRPARNAKHRLQQAAGDEPAQWMTTINNVSTTTLAVASSTGAAATRALRNTAPTATHALGLGPFRAGRHRVPRACARKQEGRREWRTSPCAPPTTARRHRDRQQGRPQHRQRQQHGRQPGRDREEDDSGPDDESDAVSDSWPDTISRGDGLPGRWSRARGFPSPRVQ